MTKAELITWIQENIPDDADIVFPDMSPACVRYNKPRISGPDENGTVTLEGDWLTGSAA